MIFIRVFKFNSKKSILLRNGRCSSWSPRRKRSHYLFTSLYHWSRIRNLLWHLWVKRRVRMRSKRYFEDLVKVISIYCNLSNVFSQIKKDYREPQTVTSTPTPSTSSTTTASPAAAAAAAAASRYAAASHVTAASTAATTPTARSTLTAPAKLTVQVRVFYGICRTW